MLVIFIEMIQVFNVTYRMSIVRNSMDTFGKKVRLLRKVFNVSQKQLGSVLGLEHFYISRWESGKHKPWKERSDAVARYFMVWHRWLYEDNEDFPIFLGTILFRPVKSEASLRALTELIYFDGGTVNRILLQDKRIVVAFFRSGTHPTSYFIPIPTDVSYDAVKDALLPFVERAVIDLDKELERRGEKPTSPDSPSTKAGRLIDFLRKPLKEHEMDELLSFESRKDITRLTGVLVDHDRGIILKPHGRDSRIIVEDKVRSLYDYLVKMDITAAEINEAVRRYTTTRADKISLP